ncbi:MAG: hypothetical protein JSW27_08280 [Phycisphaerales bacterium]|nr:MAG: hypothetical protein JSW27_08280 [Phycisphaerales bacterium]
MSLKYVVINDGKLVIERWAGAVGHAELLAHERRKLQDESIAPGARVLTDAQAATLPETTLDRVHEIAEIYGDSGNRTRISASAAIFGSADFEKGKVWEAEVRKHGVNAIVFNNLEVACIWLGIDLKETQELLDHIDT